MEKSILDLGVYLLHDLYSFSQREEENQERRSALATHYPDQILLKQSFQNPFGGHIAPHN